MARFRNLWSVWIAAGAALVLVALALVAQNANAHGTEYSWAVALAPVYVLLAGAALAVCGVCVAHREALGDDPADAHARERAESLASAAPALAWSCTFIALALATLIVVNVRADSSDADASWTPAVALALTTELVLVAYCALAACARQYALRSARGAPPPLWTRPIDAAVCCWTPPADYDDDVDSASPLPPPPHRVADELSDAPLYLYECGGGIVEHARCCAAPPGTTTADGALVALGALGCVVLLVAIVSTVILFPYAAGTLEHVWPLFLAGWIVAPCVLGALLVAACRAGTLSRHRYARWSTLVAALFVALVVVATILAAAATETTSAHTIAAPLYAALALVACFHCCAATSGARTGLLVARHDYHSVIDATGARRAPAAAASSPARAAARPSIRVA